MKKDRSVPRIPRDKGTPSSRPCTPPSPSNVFWIALGVALRRTNRRGS